MTEYYQRDALERSTVLKGDRLRCDGKITMRGTERPCGQVLVEVIDKNKPSAKNHVLLCRRCGKKHVL